MLKYICEHVSSYLAEDAHLQIWKSNMDTKYPT